MNFISNIQQRKASNIVYSKDINSVKEAIKNNKDNIFPNNIVITSYNINNIEKEFNKYDGTSYEMFYIDNKKNINRLSYNIQEGNGITLSDYKLYLGVDYETIKYQGSKKTLYIDNDKLRNAYYNYKGITKGDNEIYIDSFVNDVKEYGTVSSVNGEISLNPGVMMEMREIAYYFNKYINLNDLIKDRIIDLLQGHIFNVGDILYRNPTTNELTFKQYKGYEPYMVCIIGSNVMDDRYPRFIPINNHTLEDKKYLNAENNILNTKSLYNKVPVYEDDLFNITEDSEIVSASYGYIATNQANWENNWANPFYKTVEHYFANSSTDFNSELKWWIYQNGAHKFGKYSIDAETIETDSIEAEDDSTPGEFNITVNITFSDGFTSDYDLTMAWSDEYQNFYNKYAVQPKKSYRTPLDDVKAHNEGESVELNLPQNPYDFGSSKHLEPVPENLKGFIREDEQIDFTFNDEKEMVFGRPEEMQQVIDQENDNKLCNHDFRIFNFSNEIYYGCGGGGCGSHGGGCTCNAQYPSCTCDNHCSSNCNNCASDCSCVSGVCGSFCGTDRLCDSDCLSFTRPTHYTYTHDTYTFALNIKQNLLEDELECAYLKMYVTDGNLNGSQYYTAKYNNNEISYIFTKYNNASTNKGGQILILAYSSPNYADTPINLGQNNIVKYTMDKTDLVNSKIFSFGNNIYKENNIVYGEGETGTEGEGTGEEENSTTKIITCTSVYPQVISCSSVSISGCTSDTTGGCTSDTTGGCTSDTTTGENSNILKTFKVNPTNKNMSILKGKSKTITISTTPDNYNASFSWYFDNEDCISIEKSINTKTCIIYGVKKTSSPITLTIQCIDYPDLPKIYKNISIVENESEVIEDNTENGTITIEHVYNNYYKYTFGQIPFSFNLDNCLIDKIYKKTKTGNTIIKLMPDNGEVRNIGIYSPLQFLFIPDCLKQINQGEYEPQKGFIVIIPDTNIYPDFDPKDVDSINYEIQVEAYFRPYKINNEIASSHKSLGRFELTSANSNGKTVFITKTKNNIKLTETEKINLHTLKIVNVYQGNSIIFPNIMKFGQSVGLNTINIQEVSDIVNE